MLENIDAIYEDGVLRPLEPLNLPEHQHVRISIAADANTPPAAPDSESFFDAASRLGYIGCIEGTPPDLSKNEKYMEGFGKNGA